MSQSLVSPLCMRPAWWSSVRASGLQSVDLGLVPLSSELGTLQAIFTASLLDA